MRVAILTDSADRHFYFASRIVEQIRGECRVILGGKRVNRSRFETLKNNWKRRPLKKIKNKILNVIFRPYGYMLDGQKKAAERQYFTGQKEAFFRDHADKIMGQVEATDRSINDARFVGMLRDFKPDIIAVMGTTLVSKKIIEAAPVVINLHTGLSPYYRGGMTNFWPYIYGDRGHFGVTIHRMSTGIDAGEIIHSGRIKPEGEDNYAAVNCKAIMTGTALMIDAIERAAKNEMHSIPQWEKGLLFNNDDYNHYQAYRYFKMLHADGVTGTYDGAPDIVQNGVRSHAE